MDGSFGGYVHAPRARWGAVVVAALAAGTAGVIASRADTASQYLTVWVVVGLPAVVPAALLAPRALREVELDARSLRSWYVGMIAAYLGCALVYPVGVHGWAPGKPLILVATVVGIAAFGYGNAMALRARSGQRAMLVDLFDVLVATVAILGPVALIALEPIVTSPHAWLAVPAALVAAGSLHALGTALLRHSRSWQPGAFGSNVCVAVCAVTLLDAGAQVAQALSGFALAAGPIVALHVLTMSNGMLTTATVERGAPPGLGRLPPQRQVRKNGPLTALVLASVGVMLTIATWRHDEPWTLGIAVATLGSLAALATLRQVGLASETVRLYGAVERAADERRELLAEVMRYIDGDRTRAAAQIHRQAARLYTSVALSSQADSAASQVRVDLARQVDLASEVLTAMQTSPGGPEGLERLGGLIRAYVGTLYGDDEPPVLDVDIADGLVADWLDEAVAFRIVQMALHNVWRHARAGRITVSLREHESALVVVVADDGVGFDPATVGDGSGIVTLHDLAQLVGGRVEVDSAPGTGTRVTAVLAGPAATSPPRTNPPRLRVLSGGRKPPART
jgi:signal transduction histidine kinase